MLSRVASCIYWMARYAKRAENLARFTEVTFSFSLDQPDSSVEQWEPLVRATGDEEYFAKAYGDFTSENVRRFLTFDADYHGSILTAVTNARENARTVREAIPRNFGSSSIRFIILCATRRPHQSLRNLLSTSILFSIATS